jgi:phosphatidylinositol 3-kinase
LSANLNLILRGVRTEKVKVFTSASKPLLLPFYYRLKGDEVDQPNTFTMMFKTGDDMRQDQLVLQLFSIMDRVLKEVNLDCKFTIYDLIAFTTDDGLLPFVPDSETITAILKEDKSITAFLKKNAKDDEDYERILNNYIFSCAGYCTATYLLGIGDRHLENLMITKDGMFFHIDFGFIFGKEPNGFK